MFSERQIVKLEEKEDCRNGCHFNILGSEMKLLKIDDISVVYQPQRNAANDIIKEFTQDLSVLMVMALGKTQSGKTGVMYACIQIYTSPEIEGHVPVMNIYVITGLSSNEWKTQTKERLPQILKNNVFHRNQLKEFMESIKGKKNILVLMDEVQIACGKSQTIAKQFSECGLLNQQFLMENDIKLVEFSATPNGTFKDSELWGDHSKMVKVMPGPQYTSATDLKNDGRVFQCKNLCDSPEALDNINEIKEKIDRCYETPRYHFIRTNIGIEQEKTLLLFKEVFGEDMNYILYDSKNVECLDEYLGNSEIKGIEPEKHTFIFLKEMARCAKTFNKEHIGIWYERDVKCFNDDIVIQGLLGRATGYDDNGDSIIFTNIESIDRYSDLWDSNFSDNIQWNSNSTNFNEKKKKTISKKTFNAKISDSSSDEENDGTDEVEYFDNNGVGYKEFDELKNKMKFYIKDTWNTNKIVSNKSCRSRNVDDPTATEFHISSTHIGSVKDAKISKNRMLMETYLKISPKSNLDKKSRIWMVYPVYMNAESKPEEVMWFGKCLINQM